MKDNLDYGLSLAKYYLLTLVDKLRGLSTLGQGLVVLLVALLAFGGMRLLSGGEDAPEEVGTTAAPATAAVPAEVPDLILVPRGEAMKKLQDAGFTSLEAQQLEQYAGTGGEVILEQSPEAGATVYTNEKVVLGYGSQETFNKLNVRKKVPATKGLLLSKAEELLKREGFTNLSYDLPKGRKAREYKVTEAAPAEGTEVALGEKITLAVSPGMDIKLFNDALKAKYVPYAKIAKLENPEGRTVKITLVDPDKTLTTQAALHEAARLYKVGMEQVVGEGLDRVLLVNPASPLVGDSLQALREVTSDGLSLEVARVTCDARAEDAFPDVEVAWETGLQGQQVKANSILLTVAAEVTTEEDVAQTVIIKCEVGGNAEAPEVLSFQAN